MSCEEKKSPFVVSLPAYFVHISSQKPLFSHQITKVFFSLFFRFLFLSVPSISSSSRRGERDVRERDQNERPKHQQQLFLSFFPHSNEKKRAESNTTLLMLRSRIVASSSTKKRYAVLEICSSSFASSSSSSSSPVLLKHSQNSPGTRANDGGEQHQQRGNKDDDANPSPPEQKKKNNTNNNSERRRKKAFITIRRAIEIKSEDDAVAGIENTTRFAALERVQNVLLDARATTAIGDVLFGIITAEQKRSSSFDDAKEEEEKTKTFTTRRSLFLNACREEREEDVKDEDEEDDGRGLAFLLRRKNFATGNEYWTIVAKARRDLSTTVKKEEEEAFTTKTKKKNGSSNGGNTKKKTLKEENKKDDDSNNANFANKPSTSSSDFNNGDSTTTTTTTPIKTRSFRIDDPSQDASVLEAKERAMKFSFSRAFNEWLHDQPIAKNPRRAGLGGSRKRAMKHPCAYTGEMGEDFIDCACGDNEEYGFMLACETCGAWEHGECCGVKSEEAIPEGYACSTCVKEKTVKSFPKHLVMVLDYEEEADVKKNKNKKDAFNDNSAEKVEENEALVQEMIKNGEIIEDDDWGLQSFVAKSLGIDSKREFVLPPNSQSSNLVNAKRRCVCCVCGCEHTDEIESMVKACNCVGGGAIAHRDCLEEWEDEDKGNLKLKNGDKNKKESTTESKGGENKKKKMVDGIIVDVIEDTSLPVTPSGTRSWKILDDFPVKKCRACCGFGGLACGGIKDAKEGEAIIQNQKRILAEAAAMYEANAKTTRGNRPGATKPLLDVKEEDASGGDAENEPVKEKKKSGGRVKGSPNKKEKKTSDRPPKLMTNKQDKKPPAAKGTTLIKPSTVNGVSVKKEEKKVLHHNSSGTNNTTSSVLTHSHIPLKKRRLMMFEEDSRNGMYKQH